MQPAHALILACLVTAFPALAQSLNIDIDQSSGTGSGTPSIAYTAAGGQIGHWNSFLANSGGPVPLLALNGTSSGVSCTKLNGSSSSSSVSGATTDYSRLIFDYMSVSGLGASCGVSLNGLSQGLYRVYVYSALPGSAGSWIDSWGFTNYYSSSITATVGGVTQFSANCGGQPVPANSWIRGTNYVVGTLVVGSGSPVVQIKANCGWTDQERAAINGIQLVKINQSHLYVDKDASGANTGLSWTNAFTRLTDAIDFAKASQGAISEIWVAEGTYYPTGSPNNINRNASFELVQGCKILGGFAGVESLASQRDPESNAVYLSGDIASQLTSDNSYHVLRITNVNSTAVLDGVTITGGNHNAAGNENKGGGAWITNASPTFRNVRFVGNNADGVGGAVFCEGSSGPTFEACLFLNNTSDKHGGAIDFRGLSGWFAPVLRINRCRFIGNQATVNGSGSGVCIEGGTAWIANSVFSGGYAGEGGAVAARKPGNGDGDPGYAHLYNCTVVGNSAFVQSGGLYAEWASTVSARNCIIYYNTSGNAWLGKEFENLHAQPDSTMSATYCNIQDDDRVPYPGVGNFLTAPGFVDYDGPNNLPGDLDDDLRLSPNSPCIDRGTNSLLPTDFTDADADGNLSEITPWDLAGMPRLIDDPATADFGAGTAPIVDVGAYEFQAPPCPADYNQDGGIDGGDVEAFFADWQNGNDAADVNRDGGIDGSDVEAFYAAWESGGC
ncbi:MAG: hypothetical protein JNK25_13380 [Phycisphaerae bacterium]|nr:hypothetical protein [Phycisphaerae bacterium]